MPRLFANIASLFLVLISTSSGAFAQGSETVVFYHTDAIGSVRVVTDASGQVLERYDDQPFGGPWLTPPTRPEARRFAGKERDVESGFDYFGARYYTSGTGRFTSVDPVLEIEKAQVEPQRWNRYAYALNSPLRVIDPDGRNPLVLIPILYGLYELGSTAFDVKTAFETFRDSNATWQENVAAGGGLAAGIVLPGGGYGTAGKLLLRRSTDIADSV